MKFSFLKIYLIFVIITSSSNAVLWSLSYYQLIESQIKSDVTLKMDLQIKEVEKLKLFYEKEIKTRADAIKINKTKLNKLDVEVLLLLKKISKKEEQIKRLVK